MAILGLQGLGNGLGFVYIVSASGSNRITTLINSPDARETIFRQGLTAGPSSGETIAVGSTTITGHAGTITNVTINGVGVMGAVAASGGSDATLATDLANKVNASASSPKYTAIAVANVVYYYAAPGTGSGPNGFAVVSTDTAGTTTVDTPMGGGSPASGVYDSSYGYQFYINDDPNTAAIGLLTGAVEITGHIVSRSLTTPIYKQSTINGSGILTLDRVSSLMYCPYGRDGVNYGVVSMAGAEDGDTIVLVSSNVGNGNNIQDYTVSAVPGANIRLNGAVSFASGNYNVTLTLRYDSTLNQWVEWFRTPAVPISTASFRAAGLAYPVDGVTNNAINLAGSTVTITAGTSKKFQQITGTGSLTGSSSYNLAGGAKDGDYFVFDYQGTITYAGGFTITIAGITLNATQALVSQGSFQIYAYYSTVAVQWFAFISQSAGVGLATLVQLATKEPGLGNPGISGYVLSSTVGGVRSWVPNASSPVYYANTGNSGTHADVIQYVLKTYLVSGGTLVNSGDAIEIDATFVCTADANGKLMTITYGATTIWTSGIQNFNGEVVNVKCRIVVVDGTNESASAGTVGQNVLPIIPQYTTPTETISGDVLIQCTGQNSIAVNNDIICKHMTVKIVKHI